jgi:hypothetical protein
MACHYTLKNWWAFVLPQLAKWGVSYVCLKVAGMRFTPSKRAFSKHNPSFVWASALGLHVAGHYTLKKMVGLCFTSIGKA